MKKSVLLVFCLVLTFCLYQVSVKGQGLPLMGELKDTVSPTEEATSEEETDHVDVEFKTVFTSDPIQPYNRTIFSFNDKFYHYGIKPLSKGYSAVVPEPARRSVRKFFLNLKMPKRLVNCLLQGKFKGAGTEGLRFLINSTVGIVGFFDPAAKFFDLKPQDEDFGQTLGHYHTGQGSYIVWPFLGPSNVRDTIGFIGDVVLDPLFWISFTTYPGLTAGVSAYDSLNGVSLDKGKAYEGLTVDAIDPYIALQDAYIHNRIKRIRE